MAARESARGSSCLAANYSARWVCRSINRAEACAFLLVPGPRPATATTFWQRAEPIAYSRDELRLEFASKISDPLGIKIVTVEIAEGRRNRRRGATPIYEIIAPEHVVRTGILFEIVQVQRPVRKCVVRSFLDPSAGFAVVIDVIAVCPVTAAFEVWSFVRKACALPIFLEGKFSAHAEHVNQMSGQMIFRTTAADNQITCRCSLANMRLTGGESAHAVERVWRETKISGDLV